MISRKTSARLRSFASAVTLDLPWSRERSRATAFLQFLLAGTLTGALQGVVNFKWCLSDSWLSGDAFVWDSIEFFAWIGVATGLSVGTVFACSRKFIVRITLSPVLAALAVYVAIRLYAGGRPMYLWCAWDSEEEATRSIQPLYWALWLGGTGAGAMACTGHALRRFGGKVKLQSLSLLVLTITAMRIQSFAPDSWGAGYVPHSPPPQCAGDNLWGRSLPMGLGSAMVVLGTGVLLLYGHLIARLLIALVRPRLIPGSMLALTLLSFAGLAWAGQAMPCTASSTLSNLAFTTQPDHFFTAHEGETLRLWKLIAGRRGHAPSARLTETFRLRHGPVRYSTYALSPKLLAAGSEDGWISLWELPSIRLLTEFQTPVDRISHLSLSQNGTTLAASDFRSHIHLWSLREDPVDDTVDVEPLPVFAPETETRYYNFSLSPDGKRITTISDRNRAIVYDVHSRKPILARDRTSFHGRYLYPPFLSGTGRYIASRSQEGPLFIDDLLLKSYREIRSGGIPVGFSPEERILAVEGPDSIELLELESGKILKTVAVDSRDRFGGFSPDGRHFLVITGDGSIDVFDRPR